jgi:hypothetical protein
MRTVILLCTMLAAAAPACVPLRSDWCAGASVQTPGNVLWSRRFLGDGSAEGVAVDATGNVAITGSYRGAINLDDGARGVIDFQGLSDMFVAKLNAQGKVLWTRHFGGERLQLGHDVAFDGAGNVIAVGEMAGAVDFGAGELRSEHPLLTSAAMVVKFDSSGRTLWAKLFEDAERAESVAVDASGDAYVTLVIREGLSVVKLDPEGKDVFRVRFSYKTPIRGNNARIVTDGRGHLVVVSNHLIGLHDLVNQRRDGIVEHEHLPWMAKLDESGNVNWIRSLGKGVSRGVAVDMHGDIMSIGAASHGEPPFGFAEKIAADGRTLWTRNLGPRMSPYGVAVDANDNMIVTGVSVDGVDVCEHHRPGPKHTAFLAKLDPAGSLVWGRPIELGVWGGGEDVAVHPSGAIVTAGFGATGPSKLVGPPSALHMFLTRIGP